MVKYCIGIDIGGTSVKFGLFTTEGELLEKWSVPTNLTKGEDYILENIVPVTDTHLTLPTNSRVERSGGGGSV